MAAPIRRGRKSVRDMTKHLFFEGPSGCGKSSAILRELNDLLPYAGGFCTSRMIDEKGNACGFRHVAPIEFSSLTELYEPGLTGMFIESFEEEFSFHREVVRTTSLDMLRDSVGKRLYLIDEIGGTELQIPEFTEALIYRLNSEIPCVGVWKAENNSLNMKRRLKTGNEYLMAYSYFRDFLTGHKGVTLISLNEEHREAISHALRCWRTTNEL